MTASSNVFEPVDKRKRRAGSAFLVGLLLAGATLAAHGWSLGDGLFLDDHWHQKQLRDLGWSWTDLLNTTTIAPAQFMETWWQEYPIQWQYARPVSILLMKAVYHTTGGSVVAQHAVSISLHFVAACLVYVLCFRLTERRAWSVVGALLFVIYSHSVFAVGWLAAQNTVLQTMLMLAALLVYLRASGLNVGTPALDPAASEPAPHPAVVPPMRQHLFAATVLLWTLALFTRESAIMLPVILAAFDLAFGGRRHLRARLGPHLLLAAIGTAFLIWRLGYFYHPLPEVYLRRPNGNDPYLLWCVAKLMHYLCSAVWLSPMTVGPTGRFNPFTEVPGDCALMFAILAVMGTGYYFACRNAHGYWIWPLWLVLSFLPVVPVLATPHSGYLAGVGFSVAMVLAPGLRDRVRPVSIGRWSRGVAIWFLIATAIYIPIYRTLWRGMIAAERYTVAKVTAAPPPAGVTDIFFLNIPFVNIYASLCLEEAWGPPAETIRCHALTYAPDLVQMDAPCVVEQLDDHRFTVSVSGERYFSGLLGRYLIDSVRDSGRLRRGDRVAGPLFDAEILDADAEGVRTLCFTFHRPLTDERYCFYLTTPDCPAARLRFRPMSDSAPVSPQPLPVGSAPSREAIARAASRLRAGDAAMANPLFAALQADDPDLRRRAWTGFREVAQPVARATGAQVQGDLSGDVPNAAALARIRAWWDSRVDSETLDAVWLHRRDFEAIREERDGILTVRGNAGKIIRTDLYLTGPPFPGPR